jgi:phytoene dehydrogenase-like protein
MMEITIPSLSDPSMSPAGQHVMTIHAQFAPYHLRDGGQWDQATVEGLLDTILNTLDAYAPNVRSTMLDYDLYSPMSFVNLFGMTEGSLYHGELTLDQLFFMRPVPGYARYTTPVEKLYMCGSSTHPGGGMVGVSAFNAAKVIGK